MRLGRRAVAWTLLILPLLVIALSACYTARTIDRADVDKENRDHLLRLTYPQGYVLVEQGWTLQFPFVIGEVDESEGTVPSDPVEKSMSLRKFNLDDAIKIEGLKISKSKITGLSVAGSVGAVAAFALLLALTSCPAVYVVDGPQQHIVGEAYPGAIFRSVQRDDLLPLPTVDGSKLTLRLRNDNPEIQFTDSARLLIVEHGGGEQALATHDGRVMLVGRSQPPLRVVDLEGVDVLARVRRDDREIWQSDLDRGFQVGSKETREGMTASFEPMTGPLALEITAENTLWMSVVFHRAFSMLSGSFGPMIHVANKADRSGIEEWRAREGVDLRVEVLRKGEWTEVAMVQSPGMSALRKMVIPLGSAQIDEPIEVRLSGGFGFWRIGSLALTTIVNDAPQVTSVKAVSDADALLGEKDGRYQVLRHPGEQIDLTFALPPEGANERSAFLATSGYYNPLPPPKGRPQLASLRSIQTTPGGLARFGNELYAQNRSALYESR